MYSPGSKCSGEERVTLTYRSCGERFIPTCCVQSAALTPALFLKQSQRKIVVALYVKSAGNEAKECETETIWEGRQESFWLPGSMNLWIKRQTQRKLRICSVLCLLRWCVHCRHHLNDWLSAQKAPISFCFNLFPH